jgi:hypothetical protein
MDLAFHSCNAETVLKGPAAEIAGAHRYCFHAKTTLWTRDRNRLLLACSEVLSFGASFFSKCDLLGSCMKPWLRQPRLSIDNDLASNTQEGLPLNSAPLGFWKKLCVGVGILVAIVAMSG